MRKKPRLIGAAGGAVGLSGFAAALALCCTVPWAVALLGVTGAIAFARLAFLVPYALIGSVLLFVAGFWLAYRRPEACAETDHGHASQRALRWIVWITAAIVAALGAVALRYT